MAYNNYVLTQKCAALAINSWKLTWAHKGAIGVKGLKTCAIRSLQVILLFLVLRLHPSGPFKFMRNMHVQKLGHVEIQRFMVTFLQVKVVSCIPVNFDAFIRRRKQ